MSCSAACIRPTPTQAHCGACHRTFGGVRGFDWHRHDGTCLPPEDVGHAADAKGVYRRPAPPGVDGRYADARSRSADEPRAAEQGSVVGQARSGDSDGLETRYGRSGS
jgi:hypothetical protein